MTELKEKLVAKVAKVEYNIKEALYDGFRGIIIICSMMLAAYVIIRVVDPVNFAAPSKELWATIGLILNLLFLGINSLNNKK